MDGGWESALQVKFLPVLWKEAQYVEVGVKEYRRNQKKEGSFLFNTRWIPTIKPLSTHKITPLQGKSPALSPSCAWECVKVPIIYIYSKAAR